MEPLPYLPQPPPRTLRLIDTSQSTTRETAVYFDSSTDAIEALIESQLANKYTLVRTSYERHKKHGAYNADGDIIRYTYQCTCHGDPIKNSKSTGQRNRTSKKTNCPFAATIRFYSTEGQWGLLIRNAAHNHGPNLKEKVVPASRRRTRDGQGGFIETEVTGLAGLVRLNRSNLFNLKGRIALVTGGGSGIGLMITQALAVNGAKVYITGRNPEVLDKVVETHSRWYMEGEIVALKGFDVTSKEELTRLAAEVQSREACLCILVNNTGVSTTTVQTEARTAEEMRRHLFDSDGSSPDDWLGAYGTNVAGPFFATMAFLPLLQRSSEVHPGWFGTVLNVTSINGVVQTPQHHFAYNASKAASVHLTRMLAAEVAKNGLKIRINGLAPKVFPSEMAAEGGDEFQNGPNSRGRYTGGMGPAARVGRVEDMAQAVLFAVTNQYLNGQNFAVDGGYSLSAGL